MRASLLVLVSSLVAACGQPQAYKVIDVPYCQVPEGQLRSGFAGSTYYVYKAGNGAGVGPVAGEWPNLGIGSADAVESDEMLLAIVSCPTGPRANGTNVGPDLTATNLPEVCPGQQKLFHGALKAADDATARERGYAGVLRFPEVALTCPAGTLKRTTSADIEPRPK